jgi:hypothetical protein
MYNVAVPTYTCHDMHVDVVVVVDMLMVLLCMLLFNDGLAQVEHLTLSCADPAIASHSPIHRRSPRLPVEQPIEPAQRLAQHLASSTRDPPVEWAARRSGGEAKRLECVEDNEILEEGNHQGGVVR